MKKLLLALPLVAGASWAGSTYYAGTQAQPAYEKLLANLNEAAAGVLTLENHEYNAGFTHSTAITNVQLAGLPEPVLIQLKHEIQHTPVGADPQGARFSASSIVTTLQQDAIDDEFITELLAGFDGSEPFVLYSDVSFTGNVNSDLQLSKLSMESDAGNFSFNGGRFETTTHENKIDISGVVGQFDFEDSQGNSVTIAESITKFDLLQIGKGLYTGDQLMKFPSMSLTSEMQGFDVKIEDIVFDSVTTLEGDDINSTTSLSVAAINSPLPLNSLDWEFALSGLPVKGFEKYMSTMNKLGSMQSEDWPDSSTVEAELQEAFTGLLSPGTNVTNKLVLTNDGGDVIGDINVSFLGDGSATGLDTMTTVGDLLRAITVNVDLDADAPAIDLTPAAMFMMHPMAQQYIVSDGQKYSSTISVANLMLDVNGDLQPLDFMLGDTLEQPLDFSSAMADY